MKKLLFTLLLCSFIFGNYSKAQILSFSQPLANPLYLNPAFAGTGNNERVGTNFSGQWINFPGNLLIYNIFYDRDIIDSSFGMGLIADQTKLGFMTTTNASLMLSYQLHFGPFTLSAGFQGTYYQLAVTESYLYYSNGSVNVAKSKITSSEPDFSAGLLGYGKNYFLGVTVDHFNQPNESFASGSTSTLPVQFVFQGGLLIQAGKATISPTAFYLKQQDFSEGTLQFCVARKHLIGGIGDIYLSNVIPGALQNPYSNTITVILGFRCKLFRIIYSRNYSTTPNNPIGGTHEVSFTFFPQYKSLKLKKSSGLDWPML